MVNDPLIRAYLRDLKRLHPEKLNHKEEIQLFKRMHRGGRAGRAARDKLIQSFLRLAIYVAKTKRYAGVDFCDLIQEANIALMTAIERHDTRLGTRFSTFAFELINHALNAFLIKKHLVRLSENKRRLCSQYDKTQRQLVDEGIASPALEQIAERMRVPVHKLAHIHEALETYRGAISLSQPVDVDGADECFADVLEDQGTPFLLNDPETKEGVAKALLLLTPRQRQIVELIFGLNGSQLNIADTARELGVAPASVSLTLKRALTTLGKVPSLRALCSRNRLTRVAE